MSEYGVLQRVEHPSAAVLQRVRAVLAAAATVDGTTAFSDQVVLAVSQGTRTLYGVRDSRVGSPEFVGFAVWGSGEADLVIHPDFRGSGLGAQALTELCEVAAVSGAATMKSWSHGTQPAPAALLQGAGFTGIRTLYQMALDPAQLDAAVGASRPMPDGTRVVSYDPAVAEHADAWVRINSAAFADHPEQGTVTKTEFLGLTHEPWFHAEYLCFAVRGSETAPEYLGFSWVKTVVTPSTTTDAGSHTETELYVLGVHPQAAGTGIGAALFGVSLQRMRAHHPDTVTLYVDASNTTAVKLYERAGFRIAAQSTQWVRSLSVH